MNIRLSLSTSVSILKVFALPTLPQKSYAFNQSSLFTSGQI